MIKKSVMSGPASRLLALSLLAAGTLILVGFFSGPALASAPGKLPPGLTVGSITGPGQELLTKALRRHGGGGSGQAVLSGRVSLAQQVAGERENVPVERRTGAAPHPVYEPDPFTHRLWLTEETPTSTKVEAYDLERFTGRLVFDWQVAAVNGGEVLDSGRVALDLDRTRGGYLADQGLTEPLKGSRSLKAKSEERLMEEVVRLLALDLGRYPSASEIEVGRDPLSHKAKSLAAAGDWEGARVLWLDLLNQNPEYAPPLYNMGLYWERKKNPEEAWRRYKAAFVSDASARHREALTRLTETLSRAGRLPGRNSDQD